MVQNNYARITQFNPARYKHILDAQQERRGVSVYLESTPIVQLKLKFLKMEVLLNVPTFLIFYFIGLLQMVQKPF